LDPAVRLSVRGSVTQQWADGSFGASPERHRRNTLFSELALTMDRGAHVLVLGAAFARDAYVALDTPTLDYTYTSPGLFAQETWTPAPWFGATASARLDAHSRYGTVVSPRISVLFRDGTSWNLRLSAGTGEFATTPFTEATHGIDLSLLRPLTAVTAERGRSLSADLGTVVGPIEIDGSLFASVVEDPVALREVSDSSTDVELVNAAGPTRVQGAELFARYEHEPLMVTASYQYLQGTQVDVRSGLRTDVPLNPRHAGGLTIVWADEEGGPRLGLEAYYTGRQALDENPYRSVSEPYLTIDALVEMPVGPVVLFLHGEDLTDVRQSGFDPLLLPTARPGGRWTTDVWAPLTGRTINFGLWVSF